MLSLLLQGVRVFVSCKHGERFACRGSFGWSLELWLMEDWKTRVLIALEEYDVVDFAVKDVPRPEEEECQVAWKRHDVKAMNILMDCEESFDISYIEGNYN